MWLKPRVVVHLKIRPPDMRSHGMQIRSLQSSLASAESCKTAAELDAKHATESADSELRALQQEVEVLKSTAGSDKNRALQDLKASSQAGPA